MSAVVKQYGEWIYRFAMLIMGSAMLWVANNFVSHKVFSEANIASAVRQERMADELHKINAQLLLLQKTAEVHAKYEASIGLLTERMIAIEKEILLLKKQ